MVWGRGRANGEVVSVTEAQERAAKAPTETARRCVEVAPSYEESGGENLEELENLEDRVLQAEERDGREQRRLPPRQSDCASR